jgi:hypothetical protein
MDKPKRVPGMLPLMTAIASSAIPEDFDGDLMDYILSDAYPELYPKDGNDGAAYGPEDAPNAHALGVAGISTASKKDTDD